MNSPVALVTAREVRQRIRARSFVVSTVLLVLVVLAGGVANRLFAGRDDRDRVEVAVVGDAPPGLDDAIAATHDLVDVDVVLVPLPVGGDGADPVESSLRDGSIDAAVRVTGRGIERVGTIVTVDTASAPVVAAIDLAWRSASSVEAAAVAGLGPEEAAAILQPTALSATTLEPADDADDGVGLLVGMAVAVMLFLSISFFGSAVLTGVVEEKSTGVVEVLLGHIRPHQLLIGKVLGITVVALGQFAVTVVAGAAALAISGQRVPTEVWVAVPTAIGWFVGGFVFYTTLFALAGSFVSRQEDAQGAAAPVTVIMTVGYLLVFTVGSDPSSAATRVLSLLPPCSPLLMPLRIATGSTSVVEVVVAVAALVAGIVGMLRFTGVVYGRTLLHRGSRLSWRSALAMARRTD